MVPKSVKKTLQLVSRRKGKGSSGAGRNKEGGGERENGGEKVVSGLGKRIRPQHGRRVGGAAAPKTFKCHLDSCSKVFNDRASLKKHMTVHGDKLVSFNLTSLLTNPLIDHP